MTLEKFLHPRAWQIAALVTVGLSSTAIAQDFNAPVSQRGTAESLSYKSVGLRIDRSNIVSAFAGHLTRFFGDCPGNEWTGSATKENVRFISYTIPPRKDLRVKLLNLTSGKSLVRKYTQEGYGSSNFKVFKLGQMNGPQEVQYTIYNKATDVVLDTGRFSYDLTTSTTSHRRDGEWRSELFCATNAKDSIKDCDVIGGRQRLYCGGRRTENVRGEDLSHAVIDGSTQHPF